VISRRTFLVGTGIVIGFTLADPPLTGAATAFEPNAWLTITPDGAVTVHIARAEMGQGIGTALAQIVAEELDVDWKNVRVDYPVNDPKFGSMHTVGSLSVSASFGTLSRAGAAARLMLVDAAARQWRVAPAECSGERGVVRHTATGRSISYGDLVAQVPITKTFSPDELKAIPLKRPSKYRLVGTSIPRLDIPEKVNGQTKYTIDVFLPQMVYAKVAYPPTRVGGRHRTVDDAAANKVKGYLQTIITDDLVAVAAETYEAAVEARDALRITWDPGPHVAVDSASIFVDYDRRVRQDVGLTWFATGDVAPALRQAPRSHSGTYMTDFAAQAPMEPLACVARWVDGRCEIFTGTQSQALGVRDIARAFDIPADKVRIHQQPMGGSFGRRIEPDIALEAATIARAVGRSVKLIRSREEDFARGYPRTPTVQVMKAGIGATGAVTAWEHAIVAAWPQGRLGVLDAQGRDFSVLRGTRHPYEIPNQLVRTIRGEHGIPVGQYRSVGAGCTSFAVECFVDELAQMTGTDPLDMRLAMLRRQPRMVNLLKLATAKAGWGTPLPRDVGRGVACTTFGEEPTVTWTAAVAQVHVDRSSGAIRVERITCAVDCGLVINPDGVRAQLEGGLLFGLSAALKEYGTVSRGAFDQKNFEDYPILRIDEVPDVEIHVVDSAEPPAGAGEPTTTVMAPALANAIFAATGARVRQLPLLPDRVLKALADKT